MPKIFSIKHFSEGHYVARYLIAANSLEEAEKHVIESLEDWDTSIVREDTLQTECLGTVITIDVMTQTQLE